MFFKQLKKCVSFVRIAWQILIYLQRTATYEKYKIKIYLRNVIVTILVISLYSKRARFLTIINIAVHNVVALQSCGV